jgi:hypothetical protein
VWNDLVYVGAAAPLLIAAVIAAIVWRSASKERGKRALQDGLASESPAVRSETLRSVDEDALVRHAAVFVELLDQERDPDVLDALAAAIARSRWEPTDDGNIVELRRWVAGRHAQEPVGLEPPAGAASADGMAGPPGPVPSRVKLEPEPEPEPEPGPEPAPEPAPEEIAVPTVDAPPPPLAPVGAAEAAHVVPPMLAATNGADAARGLEVHAPDHELEDQIVSTTAIVPMAPTMMEPMGATDLSELVPKIRALLGEDLERMEFVSLEGEVIARWSATDPSSPRAHEDASNPT